MKRLMELAYRSFVYAYVFRLWMHECIAEWKQPPKRMPHAWTKFCRNWRAAWNIAARFSLLKAILFWPRAYWMNEYFDLVSTSSIVRHRRDRAMDTLSILWQKFLRWRRKTFFIDGTHHVDPLLKSFSVAAGGSFHIIYAALKASSAETRGKGLTRDQVLSHIRHIRKVAWNVAAFLFPSKSCTHAKIVRYIALLSLPAIYCQFLKNPAGSYAQAEFFLFLDFSFSTSRPERLVCLISGQVKTCSQNSNRYARKKKKDTRCTWPYMWGSFFDVRQNSAVKFWSHAHAHSSHPPHTAHIRHGRLIIFRFIGNLYDYRNIIYIYCFLRKNWWCYARLREN